MNLRHVFWPTGIFNVNNKNNDVDVVLMFLLLTLNIFHTFFNVVIVDFEQVNVSWVILQNIRIFSNDKFAMI